MGVNEPKKDHIMADVDVAHHEDVARSHNTAVRSLDGIAYDLGGPMGIFRSPFVFGAALLASMGGFSFGTRIPVPLLSVSKATTRGQNFGPCLISNTPNSLFR